MEILLLKCEAMQPCIVSLNFAVIIGTCFLPMKGDLDRV